MACVYFFALYNCIDFNIPRYGNDKNIFKITVQIACWLDFKIQLSCHILLLDHGMHEDMNYYAKTYVASQTRYQHCIAMKEMPFIVLSSYPAIYISWKNHPYKTFLMMINKFSELFLFDSSLGQSLLILSPFNLLKHGLNKKA